MAGGVGAADAVDELGDEGDGCDYITGAPAERSHLG